MSAGRLLSAVVLLCVVGCGSAKPSSSPTSAHPTATMPSASAPAISSSPALASRPPSRSPSPGPSASSRPGATVFLPFVDDPAGRGIELEIDDPSGVVTEARAATAEELARVDIGDDGIGAADISTDPPTIVVGWVGTVCDLTATLTVADDGSAVAVEEGLAPGCDLVPLARGVVLELASERPAPSVSTALVATKPIEAIARFQAEQLALGYWGPQATVADVAFAPAADLDARLQPPDRIVWAITVESGELPGSCPSLATGADEFAGPPCRALARATVFFDAVSGAYLGYVPA